MKKNIFLKDESFYQRHLDPINQYIDQSAYYLSKVKSIPLTEAKTKIQQQFKNKSFQEMRNPVVQFYERHNFEDKEVTQVPLSHFLKTISTENLTMAPSLTCYVNANDRPSLLSGFTDENVKVRNTAKKEAAKQKALGNIDKFRHYNGEQENRKLYNNALSGAFSSGGSIVRNPSAHSTLTSTTRTMTSIGNASNERLIMGNRHYRNPEITLNNIVLLAQSANENLITETIQKYGLRYPTVDEVMECIRYSTDLYWIDRNRLLFIHSFIERLEPFERAAIVYTGDLYHLRKFNESIIRQFVTDLSRKITDQTFDDPISLIHQTDEMYVNYVHQICLSEVKGIGKDYTRLTKEQQDIVAGTCLNIIKTLDRYQLFIETFFLTECLPPSVAYIRDSMRRSVVLSDTDSTMFSCDDWVQWYFGDIRFTDEAFAVSGAVMFMATQCIAHNLAIYSANLNVERKKLFVAAMKPEYVQNIFALTSVGKHYYMYINVKEGSVYKQPELDIKGVHLKNSASPRPIVSDAKNMMQGILDTVSEGKKISLTYWTNHVANVERKIRQSVMSGETIYLGRLNIKAPEAYKLDQNQSNYRHHVFWNEVFGPKYGYAPAPTYAAVKFPTTISSKRVIAIWLSQIQDEDLRQRLALYFEQTGRKDYNTVYIPQDHIESYGVPEEIKAIIDIENLILEHMKIHRIILESIGFFSKDGLNLTQIGY